MMELGGHFLDGRQALLQLRQYHHGKKHHAAHGIDAVYHKADFHQRILRFTPEIGQNSEKAAENHKDAIAGDCDLRGR